MNIAWSVITIGTIVIALGSLFRLQGQAIVGPEASFMYSNSDWITYGLEIIIVGSVLLVSGILIKIFKKI